jgi:hypothetical protein
MEGCHMCVKQELWFDDEIALCDLHSTDLSVEAVCCMNIKLIAIESEWNNKGKSHSHAFLFKESVLLYTQLSA